MIPSDHFVRFYNEVFKFLDAQGGLEKYYDEISRHQEFHCLETFRRDGLKGVHDYYVKIRKEENCELENYFDGEHCLVLKMTRCPSLTKALDNDAGVCPKYCLHCYGWTHGVYIKAGLYQVYDQGALDDPRCTEWIFDNLPDARKKFEELAAVLPEGQVRTNFEEKLD